MAKAMEMKIYNNLFEFGLFAFNMAAQNIFRIFVNELCYFKIELTPTKKAKEICIAIHECEKKDGPNECGKEVYGTAHQEVDFTRDCVFVALAFVEKRQLHYSISFDCTYIPSTLLNENRTINITSKNCYIDTKKQNQHAQFVYADDREALPNGITIILPCSSGGFLVNQTTGRIMSGDSCNKLLRNETQVRGMEFFITKLLNGSEDWIFPARQQTGKEITFSNKHRPIYVDYYKHWKSQDDMKKKRKVLPIPKNKVRKGCNYIDPPPKHHTLPQIQMKAHVGVTVAKIEIQDGQGPIFDFADENATTKPPPYAFGAAGWFSYIDIFHKFWLNLKI
ncbi:UNVERIFIED_CONTAM: hypothetical protein RMT77_013876 [Armadillidium vulgare]